MCLSLKSESKEEGMTLKQLEGIVLRHIEDSINIQKALQENSTDLSWLKKAFWVLASGVIGLCGLLLKIVLTKVP